jgi:hypothetical protein
MLNFPQHIDFRPKFPTDDDEDEDYDDNYDDNEDEGGFRFRRSIADQIEIEYTWFKNGEPVVTSLQRNANGFRLFQNGTLKITSPNNTAGIYRCLANETGRGLGGIVSHEVAGQFFRSN